MIPKLGSCYYPEHWPEEQWRKDAEDMMKSGLLWVRIGEFAWSRIEPEEGFITSNGLIAQFLFWVLLD